MPAPVKVCPLCGTEYEADVRFCAKDGTILTSARHDDDLVGNLVADRYYIIQKLGEGGVGRVYLAEHVKMGRRVALKVLRRELGANPDWVARFTREAANASRISHPNVAAIYDFGETSDGTFYLAMEFVDGQSLSVLLEQEGVLAPKRAAEIALQTAKALAAAHDLGIVHRDLKPDNIMIAKDRASDDFVKVVDFGIAKAGATESQNLTQTGLIIGTPKFMSPEQLAGDSVDGRSDIYALALVAFTMLTGKLPFAGESGVESMHARLSESPKSLAAARPDVSWPSAVQMVMDKALQRDPRDRYPTALDFGLDLSNAIYTMLGSSADSPRERARTPLVIALGGPGGLLVLGLLATLWSLPVAIIIIGLSIAVLAATSTQLRNRSGPTPAATRKTLDVPATGLPAPVGTPAGTRPTDGSTSILDAGWRGPAQSNMNAAASAVRSSVTGVFAAAGEEATLKQFPVALSVIAAAYATQVGMRIVCNHFPFSVGRATTADLCLQGDETLSRTHVQIDIDQSGFLVRDMSSNGVYVDGRHLHGTSEGLRIGAAIELSRVTALKFVADVPMLPDLSGRVLDNHYRLGERLHISLKSATYIASDERIPRALAVKVFSPSLMKLVSYRAEFRRQAELAAKLQHPHICKVIDWGEASLTIDGRLDRVSFLCCEYMSGGNLAKRLNATEHTDAGQVCDWIEMIAAALQHAHDNGIVHGDVKPNCIVFDASDNPYLTDFALAIEGPSSSRAVVGNPDYLAPEQWAGQSPSARTDQYSLAVLAYFMLTGSRPHEGQADPAVRARNFERGPTPAHEEAKRRKRDNVNRQGSAVLARAMSVRPDERYESTSDFSRALRQAMASTRQRTGALRIFFSYNRATGAPWATHFSSALREQEGYYVFLDAQVTDRAGQISDLIKKEIEDCDVFVCLLGAETLNSKWVRQEINNAARYDKPMVPIFQEGFKPSEVDKRHSPGLRRLLNYPAVHLFDVRNVHVAHTIRDLSAKIKTLMASSD